MKKYMRRSIKARNIRKKLNISSMLSTYEMRNQDYRNM